MSVVNAKGLFAAARRIADDERDHPGWSRSLKSLRKLIAYSEAIVGPHSGNLPSVDPCNEKEQTDDPGYEPPPAA